MGNQLAQNKPKLNLSVSASFNIKESEGEIVFGQRNSLIGLFQITNLTLWSRNFTFKF